MLIYRDHRGTLEESMKTARVFKTEEEIKQYICSEYYNIFGCELISLDDIVFGDVIGSDQRIKWRDVRYVLTKRIGKEVFANPQCIGLCGEIDA